MHRSTRRLSLLLIGLGVGAILGQGLGPVVVWPGIVVGLIGLGMGFAASSGGSEQAGAALPADSPGDEEPATKRPVSFAHLGPRVEEILRLAEKQAESHRQEAKRDAERIVAEARERAQSILDGANAAARSAAPEDRESPGGQ